MQALMKHEFKFGEMSLRAENKSKTISVGWLKGGMDEM